MGKKMRRGTGIFILLLCALTAFSLAACGPGTDPPATEYTVTVTGGTGGGTFTDGESCTVTATVPEGKIFVNWTSGGTEVSTDNPYTFTVTKNITLTANFEDDEPPAAEYTVTVNGGTGGGTYTDGGSCTVTATVPSGKAFKNWTCGGTEVSTDNPYTFTVTGDITLTANFEVGPVLLEIGKPDKINYEAGENFDPAGMTVTVKSSDGTGEVVNDYQVAGGTALAAVTSFVTVKWGSLSKKVSIKVGDPAAGQRFEAEAAKLTKNSGSTTPTRGNEYGSQNPSGMGFLGRWNGHTVVFEIHSDKAATADLYFCGGGKGANTDTAITSLFNSLKVNGTACTVAGGASISTVAGVAYFNWTKVLIAENVALKAGTNTIAFDAKSDMNFDYIEFATDAGLSWADEEEHGHEHTDWIFITEPAEYKQGEIFRHCAICKITETAIVPALSECTLAKATAASAAVRGTSTYTFTDWWETAYEFTMTDGAATGEIKTTRFQIEDVPAEAYPGVTLANVDTGGGEDTYGGKALNFNLKGGVYSFWFTADRAATVTLYVRIAKVNNRTCLPFNSMTFEINGRPVCVDPAAVIEPFVDGVDPGKSYFSWVDVPVAVFEIEEGVNVLKLLGFGSSFTNIDDIRLDSAAELTPIREQFTVTVIGGTGGGKYEAEASCTVTADAPASGKEFLNWTDESGAVKSTNAEYGFTVTGDITLTANYVNIYTVTVIGGSGSGPCREGQIITVTATVPGGQVFVNWTDESGTVKSTDAAYEFTVTGNITLTANFKTATASYTVTVSGGTVTDGTDTDTELTVLEGTSVTATATVSDGKVFVKWSDESGNTKSITATYTFDVTDDLTLTAVFKESTAGRQRFEAEAAEVSASTAKFGNDDNNDGAISGTGYLAGWGSATITFEIYSYTEETTLADLYFCGGGGNTNTDTKIATLFNSFKVNDAPYVIDPNVLITTRGGTAYFNWTKVLIVENIQLVKGLNTFVFAAKAAMNFDYIELDTEAELSWAAEWEDGHTHTDWVFLTEPTENEPGEIFRHCAICRATEAVTVPKLSECTPVGTTAPTAAIRGKQTYTFTDASETQHTFTLTAGAATGTIRTTRIQAEDVPLSAYPGIALVAVSEEAGNNTHGGKLVGLNNGPGGIFTFEFTADQVATVALYIRISKVSSRTLYPFKNMAFELNGKPGCIDPTAVIAPFATGDPGKSYFSWFDVPVAVFEVTEGTNIIKLIGFGSRFTNFDDIRMDSAAELIWTGTPTVSTQYTVAVTGGTGGGTYARNIPVTVTAGEPEPGKAFLNWTDGGGAVKSTNAVYTFAAAADITLTANYVDTYTVAVNGGTGGGTFNDGASCTVTAGAPEPGKAFLNWTDGEGNIMSADPEYTFPVTENITLTANYVDTYTVTVNGGTGGGTFNDGASCTVTAGAPESGKLFSHWEDENGIPKSTDAEYGFTVTGDIELTAVYVDAYTVTVVGGTVTDGTDTDTELTVASGVSVTVTADEPEPGKVFVNWTDGEGNEVSTDAEYTFDVAENITLTANYEDE